MLFRSNSENNHTMALINGQTYMFLNKKYDVKQEIECYRKKTANDILRVANNIFTLDNLSVSVVSKLKINIM